MTGPMVGTGAAVHMRLSDRWTACGLGPLRRCRRTEAIAKVTCRECLSLAAPGREMGRVGA